MTALVLLKRFWPYLAGVLLLGGVILWHKYKVSDAREAGRAEQAAIDAVAFSEAQRQAEALQQAAIAKVEANNAKINQETVDALIQSRADLAGRYDDLRMRWAKAKADSSRARQGGAVAAASSACRIDDPACRGLVDIEIAIAASEAADKNAALVNAWIDWWSAQAKDWPK